MPYTIKYYDKTIKEWRSAGLYDSPPTQIARTFRKNKNVHSVRIVKVKQPDWIK